MKNFILLISLIFLASCSGQKALEAKARHQAQTGDRLNQSQQNTENLFDELDN
jgi:hypothetical protein